MSQLPLFEGESVAKATVRITRAGDGLSEALKLEPQAMGLGAEVCFVIKGIVTQVNHKTEDEDGPVTRMHTVAVSSIAPVKRNIADQLISEEADRLQKLRDARDGQTAITDEGKVAEPAGVAS